MPHFSRADEALLRNITLLLPTYERPDYLARNLGFTAGAFPLNVLSVMVLDSSPTRAEEVRQVAEGYPVGYHRFDPAMRLTEKLYEGLKQVQTPLVAILADDDFFNPEGLLASVRFLLDNHDYTVASGQFGVFRFQPGEASAVLPKPSCAQLGSVEEDSPLARLLNYSQHYAPLYYCVNRTSLMMRIYEEATAYVQQARPGYCQSHEEMMIEFLKVVHGKYKKLPHFYSLREIGQSTTTELDRLSTIYQLLSPYDAPEYASLREVLRRHLAEVMALSGELCGKPLEDIIDVLYGTYIHTTLTADTLLEKYRNVSVFRDHFKKPKKRSMAYYLAKYRRRCHQARTESETERIRQTPVFHYLLRLAEVMASPSPATP